VGRRGHDLRAASDARAHLRVRLPVRHGRHAGARLWRPPPLSLKGTAPGGPGAPDTKRCTPGKGPLRLPRIRNAPPCPPSVCRHIHKQAVAPQPRRVFAGEPRRRSLRRAQRLRRRWVAPRRSPRALGSLASAVANSWIAALGRGPVCRAWWPLTDRLPPRRPRRGRAVLTGGGHGAGGGVRRDPQGGADGATGLAPAGWRPRPPVRRRRAARAARHRRRRRRYVLCTAVSSARASSHAGSEREGVCGRTFTQRGSGG